MWLRRPHALAVYQRLVPGWAGWGPRTRASSPSLSNFAAASATDVKYIHRGCLQPAEVHLPYTRTLAPARDLAGFHSKYRVRFARAVCPALYTLHSHNHYSITFIRNVRGDLRCPCTVHLCLALRCQPCRHQPRYQDGGHHAALHGHEGCQQRGMVSCGPDAALRSRPPGCSSPGTH